MSLVRRILGAALFFAVVSCGSSSGENTSTNSKVTTTIAPTVGYKLAAIDGDVGKAGEYEMLVSQVSKLCRQTEIQVADLAVRATQILLDYGVIENTKWVLEQTQIAIPPEAVGSVQCSEVIAILISSRTTG